MSAETGFLIFSIIFYGIIAFTFLYFLYVVTKLIMVLRKGVKIREKELEFFENNATKIKTMELPTNYENKN